jgi:hypothetical protein
MKGGGGNEAWRHQAKSGSSINGIEMALEISAA